MRLNIRYRIEAIRKYDKHHIEDRRVNIRFSVIKSIQALDSSGQIRRLNFFSAYTYSDRFNAHPPFQINGNFGRDAAAEILLQSQTGGIELLRALPTAWPPRHVNGLRARGGFEIAFAWDGGKLTQVTIKSVGGRTANVRHDDLTTEINLRPGGIIRLNPDLQPAS